MLLIPPLLGRLEITRIQRQGNELSRESRSCTSWPHLQRISSYSPAMRGSRYARRTSCRKCFLPIWHCASRARSSEEELSDTFHRYGTVCHCMHRFRHGQVSRRPKQQIVTDDGKKGERPRRPGCEKPASPIGERKRELASKHVSCFMNALLMVCYEGHCSGRSRWICIRVPRMFLLL